MVNVSSEESDGELEELALWLYGIYEETQLR